MNRPFRMPREITLRTFWVMAAQLPGLKITLTASGVTERKEFPLIWRALQDHERAMGSTTACNAQAMLAALADNPQPYLASRVAHGSD
jgi:hypothetical protein